ncbi:sensor histidine kinase [Enterococcus sp. 9E7_DIV0242]|uniref:Sensor histidine kinase n=1 Tax=Candidatus Enterococcus clewellii TaxID=1834193 RepID=A0A242K5H1_9ENTE|nr:sensor histidine kinase [Enterococcus sp. 9E7_DIV0242]
MIAGKISRQMMALYAAFSTFLVVLFTLFSHFHAIKQKDWIVELFRRKVFYVPFFFHILLLSMLAGLLTFLLISIVQKAQYGRIEEKLRLLAAGNYDSPLIGKKIPHPDNDVYIGDIDADISAVRSKLVEMSKELQMLNSRPQIFDGETREEILEEERHRLARELHDSVSQQLFGAMMMISALNEQAQKSDTSDIFKKQLAIVGDVINASQSEMRALLLHLRPVSLEGKSLKKGIEQLLKELKTKIKIELTWDVEDVCLNNSIEDHLFRIVQELLSNTLRHAKANELEVYLHQVGENVLLRLVDDGVGFDMNENENKAGSYGLKNIRERVAGMGGSIKIISFKGQGTSVEIKVPVIKEELTDDQSDAG